MTSNVVFCWTEFMLVTIGVIKNNDDDDDDDYNNDDKI